MYFVKIKTSFKSINLIFVAKIDREIKKKEY